MTMKAKEKNVPVTTGIDSTNNCAMPANQQQQQQLAERCVIVYRDENGYGLTVSGDNPVFVQSVKEDGAAARAGVKAGDRIMKVNGTLVAGSTHMDVVQMISNSADHIALTLFGRSPLVSPDGQLRRLPPVDQLPIASTRNLTPPTDHMIDGEYNNSSSIRCKSPASAVNSSNSEGPTTATFLPSALMARMKRASTITSSSYSDSGSNNNKSRDFITDPQPVDEEKQAELKRKRFQMLHQMLTDEVQNVQELASKYRKNASQETECLLIQAQKRLSNMENQFSELQMALQTTGEVDNNQAAPLVGSKPTASRSFDTPLSDNDATDGDMLSARSVPSLESATAFFRGSKNQGQTGASAGAGSTLPTSRTFPDGLQYVTSAQVNVLDDSDSDTEAVIPLETDGPFVNFAELKNRPAHLSVFLHYLLSNCDPSSLFFYLITDYYSHGNIKEMRKWAYEIHSTFLTPTAPLRISSIDMFIVQEIDAVLLRNAQRSHHQDNLEHDESLRRIFVKARQKALDEINDCLADYRNKRMLGLGNVYGENKLNGLAFGDSSRERKIADSLLMQHFENLFGGKSDFDQMRDRQQALAVSLATVAKQMNLKPSNPLHDKLMEKCPLFVTKEKKTFNLLNKPSKKPMQIKGHHFVLSQIYVSTICYQCQAMIWGVNPQGCFCSNCDVVIHKHCARSLEDTCCGGDGGLNNRANKYLPLRKQLPLYHSKTLKLIRDDSTDRSSAPYPVPTTTLTPPSGPSGLSTSTVPISKSASQGHVAMSTSSATAPETDHSLEEKDKPTDLPSSPLCKEHWASTSVSADSGYGGDSERGVMNIANSVNVGRSQSMKSHEEQRLMKRNGENGRRTKSDVDTDDKSIALAMSHEPSVSSSSSSVSRTSLPESPSASTDLMMVGGPKASADSTASTVTTVSGGGGVRFTAADLVDKFTAHDSDLETDNDIPRLEDILDQDVFLRLKPKEKKRQEVLNELFHTERSHVRNLKVLSHLFYEPLLSTGILQPDVIKLLFANIEEILELHGKLNSAMKLMIKDSKLIGDIGGLLLAFFDGPSGERFRKAVAVFCQHQQHALEVLKMRQKKDPKLAQFLQEAESSAICRKLQLKDMLPMEMQRLTKYPLLLETAAKYTPEPSNELNRLKRCLECAKGILDAVNTAKRNSEDFRRLEELQRRLDTREFDRVPHVMTKEFKNFDFRKQTLIHDGALTWRLGKNKAVDLHVVLLEDLFVLLTKNNDGQRLSLKFHNINMAFGKDDVKFTHCPLLKLNSMMAKNVATDKKAFFVVSTPAQGPQIYELVAQTTSEKKNWFKIITEQIDMCKQREDAAAPSSSSTNTTAQPGTAPTANGTGARRSEECARTNGKAQISSDSIQDDKFNASSTSETSQSEEDSSVLVEKIEMSSQARLISPCEVQISQPTVLEHAKPVLTPFERLKRNDELIIRSLAEKHEILAKTFGFTEESLDTLAGTIVDNRVGGREAKELALAAVVQTNRILEAINEAMKMNRDQEDRIHAAEEQQQSITPESGSPQKYPQSTAGYTGTEIEKPAVPCATLTRIVAPLMKHLTGLLHELQSMEDDLRRVRTELVTCKTAQEAAALAEEQQAASSFDSTNQNATSGAINRDAMNNERSLLTNVDEYMRAPNHASFKERSAMTSSPSNGPVASPTSKRFPNPTLFDAPPIRSSSSSPCRPATISATTPNDPSSSSKSPTGSVDGEDDEEKQKEKRKQKRQRNTALSGDQKQRTSPGYESPPSNGSQGT